MLTLSRTGETTPFSEIGIGKPFHSDGRYWTRTGHETGTDLAAGPGSYGACSFFITDDMIEEGDGQTPGWIVVEKVDVRYPQEAQT